MCLFTPVSYDTLQLEFKTSMETMKELEENGALVQRHKHNSHGYDPPKVKSGIVWMNQTGVPTKIVETLNRIMCGVWPTELALHYLDKC